MKNIAQKEYLKNIPTLLIVFLILIFSLNSMAQNGVRIASTAGTADPSAMLDITSTNKGLLFPRVTLTSLTSNITPVNNPAIGLVVYNLGSLSVPATGIYFWNGSSWVQLSSGGLSGSGTTNQIAKWTASNAVGNSIITDDGTNVGIGTTSITQAFAGFTHLDIRGSTNGGLINLSHNNADADNTQIGQVIWMDKNQTGTEKYVAAIYGGTSGTTAGNRGGLLRFSTKPNNGIFAERMRIDNIGNVTVSVLAGLGTRPVISDASGTLRTLVSFNCTGADQTWTCPTGITSITVKMWGAGGGSGAKGGWTTGYYGGGGGFTIGTIAVTPGQTYFIVVGQGGGSGVVANHTTSYGGGGRSCGGGTDCQYAGAGGGRSAFRNTANTADLMTAGGGGGGGSIVTIASTNNCRGGAAGAATGQAGECVQTASWGGGGGTQVGGGAAGNGASCVGAAGAAYLGGAMTCGQSYGGGGGGGWFGGGSGSYSASSMGGGGGGSCYITGAGVSAASAFGGSFQQPAGAGDPNYLTGVGFGGMGNGGGNGLLVIIY